MRHPVNDEESQLMIAFLKLSVEQGAFLLSAVEALEKTNPLARIRQLAHMTEKDTTMQHRHAIALAFLLGKIEALGLVEGISERETLVMLWNTVIKQYSSNEPSQHMVSKTIDMAKTLLSIHDVDSVGAEEKTGS